jgi:hypothetical protein
VLKILINARNRKLVRLRIGVENRDYH